MSVTTAVRQGNIELKKWLIEFKKYKVKTLLNEIIGPLFGGTTALLMGRFVGNVIFEGKAIPYAEFLAVGSAATFIYLGVLRIFEPTSDSWTKKMDLVFVENVPVYMLTIEFWFLLFASVQLIFWLLPIILATNTPIVGPLEAYVLANITMTPTIAAIGFTLAGIGMKIRGRDAWAVRSLTTRALRLLVPSSFAASAYGPLARYLLWVPTVAAMEGVRRLVFGVGGWAELLAYAIASGTVLAALAYLFFKRMFWLARKKGWIMLQ